jgi:threonine dehydratase
VVRTTPVENSRVLRSRVGGPVYLKCENLQRTGSFKIRGGYNRIARMSPEDRARGVVAASAGNHAQGVALAASLLGAASTVYMPVNAPLPKIAATRAYGAEVRLSGATVDEALVAATAYAESSGSVFIHPFDHPDVIAGQGTVGLELIEQCPDARTVLVPAGGGGLVSGIGVAMKAARPDVSIIAVQAEAAAAYPGSLAAGHPLALDAMATMADGIAVGCPGVITFDHVQSVVDEVVCVSEEALSRALLLCLERAKMVVEPAGAAAVAAIIDDPSRFGQPTVAVLSGGNIDPLLLLRIIRHGMASAGRYLQFRVRVPDKPGSLARLLADLASADANVLEVEHVRTGTTIRVDEVEIGLQLETRGHEHCEEVLRALRTKGYQLKFG